MYGMNEWKIEERISERQVYASNLSSRRQNSWLRAQLLEPDSLSLDLSFVTY